MSPRNLETLAKTRLSPNFILRDFLYSTSSAARNFSNAPEDPGMVIRSGKSLCEKVLEPLLKQFGTFAITFGYQCREGIEAGMSAASRAYSRHSSNPHQWDRGTFASEVYARVDILPFAVEDNEISKAQYAHWAMHHLDIDLLMQWTRSNVFCSPQRLKNASRSKSSKYCSDTCCALVKSPPQSTQAIFLAILISCSVA